MYDHRALLHEGCLMDWSDLRIFLAIAREGTLGAAARKIGQTQPTMGRRLRALEQALGQTLFQRTADGFVLTDEGTAVLRHAERIEEEALALQRHASGAETQLDGLLRLSSSDWFGTVMLAPVIAAFGKRHPRVTVELLTDARLYSLPRREADLVFRIKPFSEPEIISRKLLHIPYALYGKKGSKPPRAGDGRGVRVVTMNVEFADMPDVAWLKRALPNAEVASRSNRQAQAELCASGGGLAVLPRPLGDRDRRLVALDIGTSPPGRDTFVGYHRDLKRLARLRALLDVVIERLAGTHP
ncbi:DNA-binding transcriptional LysR family regulator [Bradyrhizobium liaoningense]